MPNGEKQFDSVGTMWAALTEYENIARIEKQTREMLFSSLSKEIQTLTDNIEQLSLAFSHERETRQRLERELAEEKMAN